MTERKMDLNSLVKDEDMVGVLIRENTRLTVEKAELEVIIEKLVEYIDSNDVLPNSLTNVVANNEEPSKDMPNPSHRGV